MCDIFALSAGHNYTAREYLPIFAEKGRRNMNGWGIGFFRDSQPYVERSSEQVFSEDQVHESFQRLARVIDSRIIVSHISCPLSGGSHSTHLHPFSLPFLDHTWLFVHVGTVQGIETYETTCGSELEVDVFSARIFEYVRDRLVEFAASNPYGSLCDALHAGVRRLLSDYPGRYAFFLANESVLFAFCNACPLMLLRRAETLGDILLVTTIGDGLSDRDWVMVQPDGSPFGKLLVAAGPDILYLGDV